MTPRKRTLPVPKTGRGEMTRRKILDAAKREIGRRGFAEASISTITAEAGVAQGTFYIYFRTKEDVMRELVLHMGRMLRHHLTEATEGARNRLDAERLGLRAFLDFVRKNPDLYKVVEESQFVDGKVYRQYYTEFAKSYRIALAAAEKRGEIAPGPNDVSTEVRAWMLMGISVFLGQRYGLWDPKTPLDEIVDAAADMIGHGLAATIPARIPAPAP
ncbi:MAG TPA: TetR/AcrR family transcriptional regulator [Ferrovibrio sp.]|uniref:TetR/AcrR family transcriptional regulator n=1 Tax=Ferrovibrio sp. TaxID=1917215 RepID=UPI002ED261C8